MRGPAGGIVVLLLYRRWSRVNAPRAKVVMCEEVGRRIGVVARDDVSSAVDPVRRGGHDTRGVR
jgi:hypothetical protein